MTSRAILNGWPLAAGQAVRAAVTPAPTPTPSPSAARLATSGTEDPSNIAALGGSNVLIQYRSRHMVMQDVTSLTLDEALFYVDGTNYNDVVRALPAGAVLNAALETETIAGASSVAVQPFVYGGSGTYTATGNETNWLSTDALQASAFGLTKFTKGDILWVRRAILFPATGASWLVNDASDATSPTSGESVRGATDNTFNRVNATGAFSGTAGTALASSRFLRPMSLRGLHSGAAVKGIGDSILHGKGGNRNGDGSATNTPGGTFTRAFYLAGIAFQKSGRDGNRIQYFTAAKMPVRLAQLAAGHYTHVYSNAGTNDLNANPVGANASPAAGTALKALDDAITLFKAQIPGLKVIWNKVICRTTSTDSFATLANQTVLNAGGALQFGPNPAEGTGTDNLTPFNDALDSRVTTGSIAYVTNSNPGVSDPTNSYRWKSNGTAGSATTDGAHPTTAAQVDGSSAITGNLTAAVAA